MENIVNIQNELKVTSIDELMDYAKGEVVELPSFDEKHPFVARIKRPSIMAMAKSGRIPNSLLDSANELFAQGPAVTANKKIKDMNMMKDMIDVLDVICEEAFVEPSYNEIKNAGVTLTDDQYLFIFDYTQRGVKALESFRN